MTSPSLHCTWRWSSPEPIAAAGSAVAIVELRGDIDRALAALALAPVQTGALALRRLANIDELVVARVAPELALLFPHGGPAVRNALAARFTQAGVHKHLAVEPPAGGAGVVGTPAYFPETSDPIESRVLLALSTAQSPLAVDVLLRQPARWRDHARGACPLVSEAHAHALRRLLHPPTIAAIGPPNVGKSTLLNALAQREVSIVADLPGTTRDHVGVTLDLAGLVVHYLDCPGWDIAPRPASCADPQARIDEQAQRISRAAARAADLLLLCTDPLTPPLDLAALLSGLHPGGEGNAGVLRLQLRADLRPDPAASDPFDLSLSLLNPEPAALSPLVAALRDRLVPPSALADPGAWRFWDDAQAPAEPPPTR